MTTIPTRILCATLSLVGAAGLVGLSSPVVATGHAAKAPVALAATAPLGAAAPRAA